MATKHATGIDTLRQTLLGRDRRRRERRRQDVETTSMLARARNDLLPDLRLVQRETRSLKAPSRNVRQIDPAHVQEVARSIATLGFSIPAIIDNSGTIIDGVVMVEAARRLGLATIPCIVVDHLAPDEMRLLRLASNRLAEKGEWNLNELKLAFEELVLADAPLEVTGFTLTEIDQVLIDDDETPIETGALEPVSGAVPVSGLGDLFELGPHRLVCGDSTDPATIDRLMGERGPARFIFTDQPYNVTIKGHVTGGSHREFVMASGEMSEERFGAFTKAYVAAALRHLADGGVFGTFIDWRGLSTVQAAITAAGLEPLNLIVWTKTNAGMGTLYRSQHELLPLARKGAASIVNNVDLGRSGRWRSNVWSYPGASSLGSDARRGLNDHPTVKPTLMLQDAILDLTNRGDLVLDPFLGSGSTLIAAEQCGRVCCGAELDPLYVDVICRRFKAVTGKSAIHHDTGLSFEDLVRHKAGETDQPPAEATPSSEGL